MANDELEYRKEQAVYYITLVKDFFSDKFSSGSNNKNSSKGKNSNNKNKKDSSTPPWLQPVAVITVLALLFIGFKVMMSGGSDSKGENKTNGTLTAATMVTMPQLYKMNKLDAQEKLSKMGFSNVQIESSSQFGDANGEQIIVKQDPVAGKQLLSNSVVTITYGSKAKFDQANTKINMPDVNGQTLPDALKKLREDGFTNIKWVVPKGYTREQVIVTDETPKADEDVSLDTEVSLNLSPGFVFSDVKEKLEQEFLPYGNFSKIENLKDRDIKMTLSKTDNSLKDVKKLNDSARSYKIAIEHILNSTIGDVTLINPGVNVVGDSSKAEVKNTKSGLTLAGAQAACQDKAGNTLNNFDIDWTKNLIQQKITDNDITISGKGQSTDSNENVIDVVVYCVVSGTDTEPIMKSFTSN